MADLRGGDPRISIPTLREEMAWREHPLGDTVLALVEAVEAAHAFDSAPRDDRLAAALARFDFGEDALNSSDGTEDH